MSCQPNPPLDTKQKCLLTLVETADALLLDGLLDAVHRARVHGRLPGGRRGLRLEPHLQGTEREIATLLKKLDFRFAADWLS